MNGGWRRHIISAGIGPRHMQASCVCVIDCFAGTHHQDHQHRRICVRVHGLDPAVAAINYQ